MDKDEKNSQTPWHALEVEEVLRDLQVHENGLTAERSFSALASLWTESIAGSAASRLLDHVMGSIK